MPLTLNLTPDVAAGLTTLAAARGLAIEEYLREIVEREMAAAQADGLPAEEATSGMVVENGLLIYGAGTMLPDAVIDGAIHRSRAERSQHILGNLS
jgi:hypothetical protein